MWAWLLIQEDENSSPQSCFTTGCKQPKVSHCVSIRLWDMLSEDIDKVLVCMLHENRLLVPCILGHVLDAIDSDTRETMLSNRWSSYVSSVVL